jgi:hypothetical protein
MRLSLTVVLTTLGLGLGSSIGLAWAAGNHPVSDPRTNSGANQRPVPGPTGPGAALADDNVAPDGYESLFDGKSLAGWFGMPHQDPYQWAALSEAERAAKVAAWNEEMVRHWTVVDGAIVNDGNGPYLTTEKEYRNFELWIDYKTVAQADSGIYLKATPQVQIWDYTREGGKWDIGADKGSGGLWNNSPGSDGKDPLVLADKPFGQWNRVRIMQVGQRTSVWLNDRLVVDHAIMENFWQRDKPLPVTGPIQLQTHGGEIQWKNIFIRELSAEDATDFLRQRQTVATDPIFDGKTWAGWEGPTDQYDIVDGTFVCKPGKGGTIYTAKEYGDFMVAFEFSLPPGGNNGLAIRYPGPGDTAYVGMCELQILDSEHPKYAKLDPRQYHGSAYGMIAAHRGYLYEPEQWNYQEVTVQGSRIRVELNGNIILDGDVAEVTDFMIDVTGRLRTKGHFGFAGHSDPVRFREVRIGELKP